MWLSGVDGVHRPVELVLIRPSDHWNKNNNLNITDTTNTLCVFIFFQRSINDGVNVSVTETVEFQDASPCKQYRFVVTGHGKYEKVSTDGREDTNGQSGKSRSFDTPSIFLHTVIKQYD